MVASFAALADDIVTDGDVDAANLHLLLHPRIEQREVPRPGGGAEPSAARACECERLCRFTAITVRGWIGCLPGLRAVHRRHPHQALRLETVACGEIYTSVSDYGPMAHARLYPGGESSGKLVTEVRRRAESLAVEAEHPLLLIDGPPGIGCAATAAIADVDAVMVVTEPTPAGRHDLQRILELIGYFGIPAAVVLNKADLDAENAQAIREDCRLLPVPVIAEIPFDATVTRAITAGRPLVEYDNGPASQAVRSAWEAVQRLVEDIPQPDCVRPYLAEGR